MTIPELTRRRAEQLLDQFIDSRVPVRVRDKVRMSFVRKGDRITLFEHHALFSRPGKWSDSPIAQFRYDAPGGQWSLFWSNRSSRWYRYEDVAAQADFGVLLREVEKDPTGVFCG